MAGTGCRAADCQPMVTLVITNSTGGELKLISHMDWAGFEPAPRRIQLGLDTFKHVADNRGSRGAVVYEVTNGYWWLLAWANQPSWACRPPVDNQVYNEILNKGCQINWDDIISKLDQATFISEDTNKDAGLTSSAKIDQAGGSPTLIAELKKFVVRPN